MIARVIAQRIARLELNPRTIERIRKRVEFIDQKEKALAQAQDHARAPAVLLLGLPAQHVDQRARRQPRTAGIGCHVMAIWMDRKTSTFTHMGGEGVPWIGQAPFTDEKHIFANLGDGTYYHSGILAIARRSRRRSTSPTRSSTTTPVAMTGGSRSTARSRRRTSRGRSPRKA
jgi:indolepyruvate ferredoxin oxidoreductase